MKRWNAERTTAVVLYVVGGVDGDSDRPSTVRDFPLVNRREGESEAAHLAQVTQLLDEAMAAGGTHLLVPREHADWLGDHPLVTSHFAEHHNLAEASAETGIVFILSPWDAAVAPGGDRSPQPLNGIADSGASDTQVRVDGVHVTGYFGRETGLGVAAKGYVRAIDHLGVPVALHDFSHHESSDSGCITIANKKFDTTRRFDINLICVNAREHFHVVEELGEEHFLNHYNIGVWAWELLTFPAEWHDRFAYLDEIWVGTSFIANALAPVSPVPVVRIPPVMKPIRPGSRAKGRARIRTTDDEFVFLFIFSFHSVFERKNPLAVIEAFKRTFSPADPVRLVIKCVDEDFSPVDFAAMKAMAKTHRISIHTGYWKPDQIRDLMAACDAYVSLHRSEGTGLTMGEAMALGKPVIGTAWSGNTDFMNVTNSFPVKYNLVKLERDIEPYQAGETWAEPSVDHAAELMRLVFEDRDEGRKRGLAAKAEIETNYSREGVARLIQERLAVIGRLRGVSLGQEESNVSEPVASQNREAVHTNVPLGNVILYVVGGTGPDQHPAVRNFPLVMRGEDTSEVAHLARVAQLVGEAMATGATHLLVPREQADWLGDHPLVANYFAEHHDLAEASPEIGIVFALRAPESGTLTVGGNPRPHKRAFSEEWCDAVMDLYSLQGRAIGKLQERLDLLTEQGDELLEMMKRQQLASEILEVQLRQLAERTNDQAAGSLVGGGLDQLGPGCADLINYALGAQGFAAQAGLFINHPVGIGHGAGAVSVYAVNERIIEIPYVFAALKAFPRASYFLDFGATESTLALGLASLGHHVVALDQRPYRLPHPRIEAIVQRAEDWKGPSRPFDAIISLSTLEHAGLGHYDERRSNSDLDLDRRLVNRFREWLKPGGDLILTAPFGPWHVDDFQRTYDSAHLDILLDGWNVHHRLFGYTADLRCWDTLDDPPSLEALADPPARAVVMLRATPAV